MGKKPFDKRIKELMGNQIPKSMSGGTWKGIAYQHIYLDYRNNFIGGNIPESCDLKGNLTSFELKNKFHVGKAHANSSQIMCINFFKKIFEKPEQKTWEGYLLKALRNLDVPIKSDEIKKASFEYEPCPEERTNFDFYMEMGDEKHVSFEIKFTESEFGGITPDKKDPNKYDRKWDEIYCSMVNNCPFLNCSKDEFYGNPRKKYYQINRNICYARDEGDVVLFLTPKANNASGMARGRKYIDEINKQHPNIRNIYWEDLVDELLQLVENEPDLKEYYTEFKSKYIEVLG